MKNKILRRGLCFVLCFLMGSFVASGNTGKSQPTDGEKELSLHALSAVLMDGDSGRVLYGKEELVIRPMASTTKIMTCILALENGNLKDVCTMSTNAAAQPKVHLGAGKGSQFYLEDLLYSLMLESHNDTAVMIAEQIGGSVEQFTEMMNQKARDIGCNDTNFITPNGLDAAITAPDGTQYTHGTTASDLAKILRYCITDSPAKESFLKITQTANYSFMDVEKKRSFQCSNHNALLTMMEGALTGKTGFTGGAGYSYVGAIEDEGRTYLIALLGSGWPPHKTYKWSDARVLLEYGKINYQYKDVYEEVFLNPVPVLNGIPVNGSLSSNTITTGLTLNLKEDDRHLKLLLKDQDQVRKEIQTPDVLMAPVLAGDMVGSVSYWLNDRIIKTYPIYANTSIKKKDLPYCIKGAWNLFFLRG